MRLTRVAIALLTFSVILSAAPGPGALALVCSEGSPTCNGALARMQATGQFNSVDVFDAISSTPTLSALSGYGFVLAWTNFTPASPTTLGNVLAGYYDLGGKRLTIATYAFSNPWAISGTVMTGPYSALTNLGTNGNVSGNLVPTGADPIFNGITLSAVQFFHNSNYTHPGLAAGAKLLATDGAGVNMIARSSNGVINVNLYPGDDSSSNQAFFSLLASTLVNNTTSPSAPAASGAPALTPTAVVFLAAGMMLVAFYSLRRRTA